MDKWATTPSATTTTTNSHNFDQQQQHYYDESDVGVYLTRADYDNVVSETNNNNTLDEDKLHLSQVQQQQHHGHCFRGTSIRRNSQGNISLKRNRIRVNRSTMVTPAASMANAIDSNERRSVLRPHSTPATLTWLEKNYELAEGVCIPRSVLYQHYVDFCGINRVQPVNAASFGKIIRQQFPNLTTRRLGTRGQSRYHYYGIAIREDSGYFQLAYSKRGVAQNHQG